MVRIFSCYPSGTILLRTTAICSKRVRRLISISVNYMLVNDTFHTQLHTNVKCFTQHVRRMRSSIEDFTVAEDILVVGQTRQNL